MTNDHWIVTNPTTGGSKGQKIERFDLVPPGPERLLAKCYGVGARQYGDRNWQLGMLWSLPYAAMRRHINAFWSGEDSDPDSGLPHLVHAAFHCFTLLEYMETHRELDDRVVRE